MERVLKRVKLQLKGSFHPHVTVGDFVSVGSVLGTIKTRKVIERLDIPNSAISMSVDEGVFVEAGTTIFTVRHGLSKEKVLNKKAGVVSLRKNEIIIGGGEIKKRVMSPVSGRVMVVAPTECRIDAEFVSLLLMISHGDVSEGRLAFLTRKDIDDNLRKKAKGKIVFYNDQISYEVYLKLKEVKANGIIVPYIAWPVYTKIFQEKGFSVGVFLGAGHGHLPQFMKEFFQSQKDSYAIVDFQESIMQLSSSAIMKGGASKLLLFRDDLWGKEIESVESYDVIKDLVTLKSKEKIIVDKSEITKVL